MHTYTLDMTSIFKASFELSENLYHSHDYLQQYWSLGVTSHSTTLPRSSANMFSECQQSGIAHIDDVEPTWRSFGTCIDKENVNPAGPDAVAVPWTVLLDEDDSATSATEAGNEFSNGSKTPGSRRKGASKLRKPLRNITPLFEKKVRA